MIGDIVRAVVSTLLLTVASAGSAGGGEGKAPGYDVREFTCPVGGKAFKQDVGYFVLSLVTFPDGSYPGDDRIDAQIPVCPDNGLVILPDYEKMNATKSSGMLYSDYSAAERAQLPALIADPAYAALKGDGRNIQGYWLATRLGRPAFVRFDLLQRATWAASDPALRKRLVERLVAEGPALIEATTLSASDKRLYRFYVVNGLRELGRFDEALALIDAIEREGPPIAAPTDPDEIFGPGSYAQEMRAVIADKDMDRFPVRLMPDKWANAVCNGAEMSPPYGPRTAATKLGCARREAERKEQEARSDAMLKQADKLQRDPVALARACANTMPDKRGEALSLACSSADEAAGNKLALDGPKLAASCDATTDATRSGALRTACSAYETALTSAVKEKLVDDEAAYAILCPGGGDVAVPDRAMWMSLACSGADGARSDAARDRLLADPVALDARCAKTSRDDQTGALFAACLERSSLREGAEVDRLANDPKAFTARCGMFKRQLERSISLDDSDDLMRCRNAKDARERKLQQAKDDAAGVDCSDSIDGPGRDCTPKHPAPIPVPEGSSIFDEGSSLSVEARKRAAEVIAKAKADRTYPKRRPGDRF
jgi:hypothetical protein